MAHAQFLTGIRVNFDLTFSNKAWVEAERYKFLEFVSSQSTMHCITKFDLNEQYNEYVDPRIIEIMREKVDVYNKLLSIIDRINRNVLSAVPIFDFNFILNIFYCEMFLINTKTRIKIIRFTLSSFFLYY